MHDTLTDPSQSLFAAVAHVRNRRVEHDAAVQRLPNQVVISLQHLPRIRLQHLHTSNMFLARLLADLRHPFGRIVHHRLRRQSRPMLPVEGPRVGLRPPRQRIAEHVSVRLLAGTVARRVADAGAQALVLQDGFVLRVVLVLDVDREAGPAGRLERVGAVEVGVVVVEPVVVAVVAVHDPLRRGAEAGGAVQGVACWGGDGGGRFDGVEVWVWGQVCGASWSWWVGEDEGGEGEDEAENVW